MSQKKQLNNALHPNLMLESQSEQHLLLRGVLDLQTSPSLWDYRSKIMNAMSSNELIFDLKHITRTDSAGVAVLVTLLSLFKKHEKNLMFINVPMQLRDIIRVSGLEVLFSDASINSTE